MKQRIHLIFLIVTCLLLLCACRSQSSEDATQASGSEIRVYYNNNTMTGSLSRDYILTTSGEEAIKELYRILQSGEFSDGKPAIPADLELDSSAWQAEGLVLYLKGHYPVVGTAEEILCRYALAQTMFQLDGVQSLSIRINEEPLLRADGTEIGIMTASDFVSDISILEDEDSVETLTLYFTNSDGTALIPNTVTLNRPAGKTLERLVVEQLIAGTTKDGYYSTLPPDLKILNIAVKDQICYLNLDDTFLRNALNINPYIPVYSLVNSLTALPEISFVQLTINGSADVTFKDSISFASPLESNQDLIITSGK